MHAGAGDGLDDFKRLLPVVEQVEHRRHLPQVLGEGAVPDQVADDPEQLAQHHPDDLGPGGQLDARQLLHRQQVGQVVQHAAEVIHPVGVGNIGVPTLALAHLLGPAVVVADVGHGADDLLPVQLQDHPQHAVGAGVVGPEVEEHELGVRAAADHAPVLGLELEGLDLGLLPGIGQFEWPDLGGPGGVVLTQGMALPPGRVEDSPQARVALEDDAEHVEDLALVPLGHGPDVGDAGQGELRLAQCDLQADVLVPLQRHQVIDDGEVALRQAGAAGAQALIDGRQVVQQVVRLGQFALEMAQHLADLAGGHVGRRHVVARGLGQDGLGAKPARQLVQDVDLFLHRGKKQPEPQSSRRAQKQARHRDTETLREKKKIVVWPFLIICPFSLCLSVSVSILFVSFVLFVVQVVLSSNFRPSPAEAGRSGAGGRAGFARAWRAGMGGAPPAARSPSLRGASPAPPPRAAATARP